MHYAWDTKDRLIKISDAEGGLWLRDYDTRGRLTEAIDPLGNKTEYAYNLMGLPIRITDANGKQKQLEYNASGQLTRYVDCSGKASAWAYDERGQMVQHIDAAGQVSRYRHEAGQLVAVQFPDNTEHRFERDAEGRLSSTPTRWAAVPSGTIPSRVCWASAWTPMTGPCITTGTNWGASCVYVTRTVATPSLVTTRSAACLPKPVSMAPRRAMGMTRTAGTCRAPSTANALPPIVSTSEGA